MRAPEPTGEKIFRGIPVSPGVCRGKILVLGAPDDHVIAQRQLSDTELPEQIQRFEQALIDTRHEILEVQRKVSDSLGAGEARIFDAHLLVLDDPTLIDEVTRKINEEKVNVEYAFSQVAEKYAATLSAMNDE